MLIFILLIFISNPTKISVIFIKEQYARNIKTKTIKQKQEPEEERQEEPDEEERGGGNAEEEETSEPPDCELREWTPWGPCSVSCGGGVKLRFRRPYDLERCGTESTKEASKPCNQTPCEIPG